MDIRPFKLSIVDQEMLASPDSFFDAVKEEYNSFKENGFFDDIEDRALYLYQIKRGKSKHLGLVATVHIEDYIAGKILKHEHTLVEKEQKIMNLIFQRRAMIKPVLLTFPPYKPMKDWMLDYKKKNKPFFSVKINTLDEKHTLWQITDEKIIERFKVAFRDKVKKVYIADGHHRSSTNRYLYEGGQGEKHNMKFDNLFSVFFDFDELDILDYNRLVDILDEVSPTQLMAGIAKYCDIELLSTMRKPKHKHEITLCILNEWYSLVWKPDVLQSMGEETVILDAHLLDTLIFRDVMNIEDVTTDTRLSYVDGTKPVDYIDQKIRKRTERVAFCLYPVRIEDVTTIADQNRVMPPKSTWFEPRIRNGMVIYNLKDS